MRWLVSFCCQFLYPSRFLALAFTHRHTHTYCLYAWLLFQAKSLPLTLCSFHCLTTNAICLLTTTILAAAAAADKLNHRFLALCSLSYYLNLISLNNELMKENAYSWHYSGTWIELTDKHWNLCPDLSCVYVYSPPLSLGMCVCLFQNKTVQVC